MTTPIESYVGEADYLRSRQLQPILRRIQRWALWTVTLVSITLLCVGQGLAWNRGLSHNEINAVILSWHSFGDYIHSISSGDPSGLMMLGIIFGIALPFVRTLVVTLGFIAQRNWLHVAIALLVMAIMLLGLWTHKI